MVMLGMFAGVLVTGLAFAPLRVSTKARARGSLTLPQLLHVPYGVVVCAHRGDGADRISVRGTIGETRVRRALAAAAAILGVLALFAGERRTVRFDDYGDVAPVELAEWIRDRKPNLRVVDVRSEAEFDEYHLPRAERFDIVDDIRAGRHDRSRRGWLAFARETSTFFAAAFRRGSMR